MPTSSYVRDAALPNSRRAEARTRSSRRRGCFQWINSRVFLFLIAFAFLSLMVSLAIFAFKTHFSGQCFIPEIHVIPIFNAVPGDFITNQYFSNRHEIGDNPSNDSGGSYLNNRAIPSPALISKHSSNKRRKLHLPCEIPFSKSVDFLKDPQDSGTFKHFSLNYTSPEPNQSSSFGGHQTLKQRENSFLVSNQTINCGFLSPEFNLSPDDKAYMNKCEVVVSSCIFGVSDFLRTPAKTKISIFSIQNVCFVMFIDSETQQKLMAEGKVQNEEGYIGLWRVVVVKKLPFKDMRRNGKIPKLLSHRLFPRVKYSIWVDSKLRLNADPLQIIEYFLWRNRSEYAISNHYDRHCVWEEVAQNKRLNKFSHTAIDEQFRFYRADGLVRFNASDLAGSIPSYVPEGSFIVRAHTPISNLFSCLWFNEVIRFTPRDQISFGYVYLKLTRSNPRFQFQVNMFKDCERRAVTKLFHHRDPSSP